MLTNLSLVLGEGRNICKTNSRSKGVITSKRDAEIFTECILPAIETIAEKRERLGPIEWLDCNIGLESFTCQPQNPVELKNV